MHKKGQQPSVATILNRESIHSIEQFINKPKINFMTYSNSSVKSSAEKISSSHFTNAASPQKVMFSTEDERLKTSTVGLS